MRIRQGILKSDDLNPDGVRIIVNWDDMVTSSSVFILCINVTLAVKQVNEVAKRRKWQIKTQIRVENKKLGVRVWRIV
tara:strand:- start:2550 stop:2783 length:234 start_codon:yes stop_codon:yes gene_type:complete